MTAAITVKSGSATTNLWKQTLSAGDTVGRGYDLRVRVQAGDVIRFVVDPGTTNSFDTTNWDPKLTYVYAAPGDTWLASTGFSSNQGWYQWGYEAGNGSFETVSSWSPMTYDAANTRWKGTDPQALVGSSWVNPGASSAVARSWTAPDDGMVAITGTAAMAGTGGDGVTAAITEAYSSNPNHLILWRQTISAGDTTGKSHDVRAWVSRGDVLRFIVSAGSTNSNDRTNWNPIVTYSYAQDSSMVGAGWTASNQSYDTPYQAVNTVYQDGGQAMARDSAGNLWSVMGQTSLQTGTTRYKLSVWKGATSTNMTYQYEPTLNFQLGAAGTAFNSVTYPDGPRSRGSIWPMGLWIDNNGKFYLYFHNETGWGAGGTGYTTTGPGESEPDFRHVGLATSTNQGQSWSFDSWVLTAEKKSWTNAYVPDAGLGVGQPSDVAAELGAGDFSLYATSSYLYMYYGIAHSPMVSSSAQAGGGAVYVARAPLSSAKVPGTWTKYYNGGWTESANAGKETPLFEGGFQPHVSYNSYLGKYMMFTYNNSLARQSAALAIPQVSFSTDLVTWSSSVPVLPNPFIPGTAQSDLGYGYYVTPANTATTGNPFDTGKSFVLFYAGNATGVKYINVTLP
ncbi:hypothetical protein [Leifsonia sp. AG29]|uniref:hypothetical protein n=1 Tax=Leifsonia sp. AG29 TaxID=2598860 RepID=UPI00131BA2C9|nr:hypothetical protein [Leifsonia sp. AG29]